MFMYGNFYVSKSTHRILRAWNFQPGRCKVMLRSVICGHSKPWSLQSWNTENRKVQNMKQTGLPDLHLMIYEEVENQIFYYLL